MAHQSPADTSGLPATFPAWVEYHAKHRGARPAMREKDLGIWQTITWTEVARQAAELANGLAALGVRKGDHVAIIGENRPRLYLAMIAVQYLGGIPVPLYQDAIAAEMLYVLQDAGIAVAVVEDQEQVDKMLEAQESCPILRHIVYDDPRGLRNYTDEGLLSFEGLLERGREFLA
ncbi:MAG TPA: AMP-binding protein, partial [Burkholderiaceae bacterium]|nr:AMP-binding protein [Burkholderiaceae bacterium]